MSQNARDDFSFGSRAWNEHYHGRNKDGAKAKGDRATRAKKALTKAKGKRATEAAQEDLREGMEKTTRAAKTALARVLPTSSTHAIKIAPASGHVTRRDVAKFEAQGWTVLPAGEALAKVGAGLPALEAVEVWPNPAPNPLGPEGKARAVVIWSPEPFSRETVAAWRQAGYDVSAAPKAYRERREARTNPSKKTKAKGHTGTHRDTRRKSSPQAGDMAKTARKTPSRKAPKLAKKANPAAATVSRDLENAWEKWTGARASSTFEITIPGTHDMPASVVLLGKLSRLITADGKLKDFRGAGPLLVTDGDMEKVWLVHAKGYRFDLDMSKGIICYLAKKPKFGDRQAVEYVHQFGGRANARMGGAVGHLSGTFRLTPRGIEG